MEQRKNIISIGADEFVKGIGLSSREGMQQVQDVDPFNIDGTIQAGFKTVNTFPDPFLWNFTANTVTDQLTMTGTAQYTREGTTYTSTGRAVQVLSTAVLPAPLSSAVTYFIIEVSANVIKLATTYANAIAGVAIDITTTGTGTHTIDDVRQEVIMHYAFDPLNDIGDSVFGQDIIGQIWNYKATSGWHLVQGNSPDGIGTRQAYGLVIAFEYLFAFNAATVDIIKLNQVDIPADWINAWGGATGLSFGNFQSNNSHTAFVPYGNVNEMFFANCNSSNGLQPYVGTLIQTAGMIFDPTNTATYTWNPKALQIPDYAYITDFEELGGYLAIATIASAIYLWDTTSTTGFQNIIPTLEPWVSCLCNINSVLYYGAGFRGNIYSTLGTTSVKILDFSDQISTVPQVQTKVNSIANYNGYMLFTVTGAAPGLYLMDISDENNRYHLKNICSNTAGLPGKIFTQWNYQLFGGKQGNNFNYVYYRYFYSFSDTFDQFSTARGCDSNFMLTNGQWRQTDGNSYFISQLYRVADNQLPYTFDQCNLYLTEPIQNGHEVIISTRKDNETSFSNPMTFDYTTLQNGDGVAGNLSINVENARMFQALVTIYIPPNTTPTTSQYVTPKLAEITFK